MPFTASSVQAAYQPGEEISNSDLYARLEQMVGVGMSAWRDKSEVGKARERCNLLTRKARWHQQTLRSLGLIERVPGKRGVWRLATGKSELTHAAPGAHLVAYSTDLGLALWGCCSSVFPRIDEPIALVLTSPPYPLRKARAYGGPSESSYTDFICSALEPLVKNLLPGGSIALNVSNDCFVTGSPARSTYIEKLTLALEERLSLSLMDRIVWQNPSKPPGPMQWASKSRQQLCVGYEPVLWFTNDPKACFADNRRVLQPHSDRQKRLIAQGGESRSADYGDGAYKLRPGSYGRPTEGRIPRNVLQIGHASQEVVRARRVAHEAGLPTHGAMMPLRLAMFLIQFLTQPGQLVTDLFAGWNTTGLAAELTERRWITTERIAEYAAGSGSRFESAVGFHTSFDLVAGKYCAPPNPDTISMLTQQTTF